MRTRALTLTLDRLSGVGVWLGWNSLEHLEPHPRVTTAHLSASSGASSGSLESPDMVNPVDSSRVVVGDIFISLSDAGMDSADFPPATPCLEAITSKKKEKEKRDDSPKPRVCAVVGFRGVFSNNWLWLNNCLGTRWQFHETLSSLSLSVRRRPICAR